MIQNILGILVGSIVTLVALFILAGSNGTGAYVTALIIGGIANFLWPIVAGIWLVRRRKNRRDNQIESEVNRQMAEQNRK